MGLSLLRAAALVVLGAAAVSASPKLRLSNTALGPFSIATGANGAAQTVEASNAGDGSLNLRVASSVPWLAPSTGALHPCSVRGNCIPINIAIQTATLAKGMFTGLVTVSDPNAMDAPQTITVTVQMGGGVPDSLSFYLPPNGASTESRFTTNSNLSAAASTQSGGQWLSVALDGEGSFRFAFPYRVTVKHIPGMTEGTYNGAIRTSNSTVAAENKTVNVSLRVTSQPIGQPSPAAIEFRIAQNTPKQKQNVRVTNAGLGALQVTGASVSTQSGGNWLSAEQLAEPFNDFVAVAADPAGMSTGIYEGAVSVAANAANAPVIIPVRIEITQQAPPSAAFQGVVNNATFAAGESVAQGDIVAVFGDQLAYGDPQGPSLPLKTTVGGATVFVNDKPAPIYFTSYSQITFQMPFDTEPGEARVRIERDGQRGNTVGVNVQPRAPRILRLGFRDYGIIVNQDGSFPLPASPFFNFRPARPGDALVIYAIGLGPTSPAVASGEASPTSPLAAVTPPPQVFLGGGLFDPGTPVAPFFVGLTPGFVGLYQINFIVPDDAPRGDAVPLSLEGGSNKVTLAIQ